MNDDFFKPGNGRRDAANHDAVDHGAIDHDAVNQGAINDIGTFFRRLQWALLLLGAGALIWVLTPVLTPFAASALLAWLGDPVVDRLQRRGLSRNSAVALVFTLMVLVVVFVLTIFMRKRYIARTGL